MTKHTDTSRSGDLVKRLRGDKYTCRENMGCGTMEFCACATMEDAADRIEALEAEVERLLARLAHVEDDCEDDCIYCEERRQEIARAALGRKQ